MKHLKKYNESFIDKSKSDDIKIVYDIFDNEIYNNIYNLKKELDNIYDKKISLGLLVDLIVNKQIDISDFDISKLEEECGIKSLDAHDYYINKLDSDIRTILLDFLYSDGDLSDNIEFINWIKSLSKSEIQKIEEICIDMEIYELITFIRTI